LRVADEVTETLTPTNDELAAIRRFDPDGFWTGLQKADGSATAV
jgi:hypothetical protein